MTEFAGNISNLLQKMIATENRQLLFIGHFVKLPMGLWSKRRRTLWSIRDSPPSRQRL
jgi:hypothetical protein